MYAVLVLALVGCFSVFGFVASYTRMALKVANYNALKRETDGLRARYQALLTRVNQTDTRLASLQIYAREVNVAFGIKQKLESPSDISAEGKLVPSFAESLDDYDSLRRANILALRSRVSHRFIAATEQPSIWPVDGRLLGPFGQRTDPFSGEGAFHKGVDISAPTGTPVRVTADGIVVFSDFESGYGRLVKVDHGDGMSSYYAHLSRSYVHPGQEVRRGEYLGEVGTTGRVTAPHLHYEVRMRGNPVNPYPYLLPRVEAYQGGEPKTNFPF
ncbi:MAG TPA: M23 family metallopeptidase [Bryobacteraceae bacterium]|nr:M23 family metallopeptidase [Bryobacteraceae bacterium]